MKTYFIDAFGGWFIVKAKNKAKAKSEGVAEFGRGMVKEVRLAKDDEIKYYLSLKGEIGEVE